MTTKEAIARVARGAALLDEKLPGWAARINIKKLRMADCDYCALGQLFGFYGTGVHSLGWTLSNGRTISADDPQAVYGFTLDGYAIEVTDPRWKRLRAAWVAAINERLAPPVSWTHREPQVHGEAVLEGSARR